MHAPYPSFKWPYNRVQTPILVNIFVFNSQLYATIRDNNNALHKYLPIICRAQRASFCVASNVDNIMDDLHATIYATNDKISMQLFYSPANTRWMANESNAKQQNGRKTNINNAAIGTREWKQKETFSRFHTCNGWRKATAQNECAPRLWNVPIMATRACFTFSGISLPLNALLMLIVCKNDEKKKTKNWKSNSNLK